MLNEVETRKLYEKYADTYEEELIAVEHNKYSSHFGIVKGYWEDGECFMYHLCYIDYCCNIQSIRSYHTVTDAFKAFVTLVQDIQQITTYPF